MIRRISHVSIYVKDQQEAKAFYTDKLGFEVKMDQPFPGNDAERWVTVGPKGQDLELVFMKPEWTGHGEASPEEVKAAAALIGKNPAMVFDVDDCAKTCEELKGKGVQVVSPPMDVPWGVSAVIADLYGNPINLVQPKPMGGA